ncbi:MAG: topoisomerase DNA-binding C4 zinc finger domain-containing protein, partial [Fimbriimonadaceae bacterium]|nr:topoisomerase DNA-binding C4 zinc finger domain-containing protein [Alphaproteobacteria bacterium]
PSTYTSTLSVLRERDYVRLDKKRLIPEGKGRLVTAFLENFFNRYVEYDFTADLEERLDKVSNGEIAWKDLLRDFWTAFIETVDGTKDLRVSEVLDALNESLKDHVFPIPEGGGDPRKCPKCEDGELSLKVGKYGAFIGCSNYPECRFTRQLGLDGANQDNAANGEDRVLGNDPETGAEIVLKSGRFGPYVERKDEDTKKPERASIPKGMDLENVDLEQALQLLSLPREVGLHPETGKIITAGLGRYGPFVLHDGKYANLPTWEEVFTVGINRAVTVLAEKKERGGRATSQTIKELGDHPDLGGTMQVLSGRYGPYVKHGKINATLPKDMKPEDVTAEQAVTLIAAKSAKGGKTAKSSARKRAKT